VYYPNISIHFCQLRPDVGGLIERVLASGSLVEVERFKIFLHGRTCRNALDREFSEN
jgi:hypothetical protein